MTATTFQNIRGALQAQAVTASGFPASTQIAYEGRSFEMTVGTPWAQLTLMPTSDGPFDVSALTRYVRGLFQVSLYYPARGGPGTSAVEAAGDNVISVFKPGTHLQLNSTIVIIDSAARSGVMTSEDWLNLPITISWRAYPAA